MVDMKKVCVYTILIGDYESLNELSPLHDQSIPFICLTDNPDLRSKTWQIRLVEPAFPLDNVRSQRRIKILAHEYLPDFSTSLYIDNTVRIDVPVDTLIEQMLVDADIAIPQHSFRETVYDEFVAVAKQGLDDAARIFEQLNHYQLGHPGVLSERPYFSGILFRQHGKPEVQAVMQKWYEHVARYSRRDQLSLNTALLTSKAKTKALEIDHYKSWFHTYPIITNRRTKTRQKNMLMAGAPTQMELKQMEHDLELARANQQTLQDELLQLKTQFQDLAAEVMTRQQQFTAIIKSSSWRLTQPLRKLKHFIAGR